MVLNTTTKLAQVTQNGCTADQVLVVTVTLKKPKYAVTSKQSVLGKLWNGTDYTTTLAGTRIKQRRMYCRPSIGTDYP
jgi:hypothetical protein